jgi:hypothetical protein
MKDPKIAGLPKTSLKHRAYDAPDNDEWGIVMKKQIIFLNGIVVLGLLISAPVIAQTATNVVCDGCVHSSDIATNGVRRADIQNFAVNTPKLNNFAVTTAKLGPGAVTTGKIADGAVSVDKVSAELAAAIGTFCPPGEAVVGMDENGQFVCEIPPDVACVFANGLQWCYNASECGQACNDVCAARGMTPVADQTAWFEAQNTLAECQAIADKLGIGGTTPQLDTFAYACLEDEGGNHSIGTGTSNVLRAPLFCSTDPSCPDSHLTQMDQLGNACGPTESSAGQPV